MESAGYSHAWSDRRLLQETSCSNRIIGLFDDCSEEVSGVGIGLLLTFVLLPSMILFVYSLVAYLQQQSLRKTRIIHVNSLSLTAQDGRVIFYLGALTLSASMGMWSVLVCVGISTENRVTRAVFALIPTSWTFTVIAIGELCRMTMSITQLSNKWLRRTLNSRWVLVLSLGVMYVVDSYYIFLLFVGMLLSVIFDYIQVVSGTIQKLTRLVCANSPGEKREELKEMTSARLLLYVVRTSFVAIAAAVVAILATGLLKLVKVSDLLTILVLLTLMQFFAFTMHSFFPPKAPNKVKKMKLRKSDVSQVPINFQPMANNHWEGEASVLEENLPQLQQSIQSSQRLLIFLSSPFGGFETERDAFVTEQLPLLRDLCRKHAISIEVADLRWGITKDQADNNDIVKVCLHEVAQCHIFVGMMGARYGSSTLVEANKLWLVPSLEKCYSSHPWIRDYSDRSITEIEWRDGCLQNPEKIPSLFLLRDKRYDTLMSTVAETDTTARKYNVENEKSRVQRERLENEVISLAKEGKVSLYKNYSTPQEGAELLAMQLKSTLKKLLPDSLDETRMHGFNRDRHASTHISCPTFEELIESYLTDVDSLHPHLVLSEDGGGATSNMAALALRYNDIEIQGIRYRTIYHMVGATGNSYSITLTYRRIAEELDKIMQRDFSNRKEDLDPSDREGLYLAAKNHFRRSCRKFAKFHEKMKEFVVIVIDGLDRLTTFNTMTRERVVASVVDILPVLAGPLEDLTCTAGVKIIGCCRERNAVDLGLQFIGDGTVTHRNSNIARRSAVNKMIKIKLKIPADTYILITRIPPLNPDQIEAIAIERAGRSGGKTIDKLILQMLKETKTCGDPKFLIYVLDELMSFGDFFQLLSYAESILKAKDVTELHDYTLRRLDRTFDADEPGLMEAVFLCVAQSDAGIEEDALVNKIAEKIENSTTEMASRLHTVVGAAKGILFRRAGKIILRPNARAAVTRRYVHKQVLDAFNTVVNLDNRALHFFEHVLLPAYQAANEIFRQKRVKPETSPTKSPTKSMLRRQASIREQQKGSRRNSNENTDSESDEEIRRLSITALTLSPLASQQQEPRRSMLGSQPEMRRSMIGSQPETRRSMIGSQQQEVSTLNSPQAEPRKSILTEDYEI